MKAADDYRSAYDKIIWCSKSANGSRFSYCRKCGKSGEHMTLIGGGSCLFLLRLALQSESKAVSGLDGGPHEVLKAISPTKSVPRAKPVLFQHYGGKKPT